MYEMTRWHERGCRFPEISIASGIPCCNYCFALPSLEDGSQETEPSIPPPPPLRSKTQMNLVWPRSVSYKQSNDGSGHRKTAVKGCSSKPPGSQCEGTSLPDTKSGDGFRLLQLKPSQDNDNPIHADIELFRLSNAPLPVYDALSYTYADEFGDSTKCCPIFIGPYWDVLYVTRNCKEALQSIRHQDADRLVWVDCLCINQQCIEEKSHQTSLIRTIYQNASWIIFYMGAKSADSDLALNLLKTAAAASSDCSWPQDHDSQIAFQSLFQRPCFSRLWPAQEVLLARCLEINCGGSSVLWQIRPSMVGLSSTSAPAWLFDQDSRYGHPSPDLLRLLIDVSPYKTSDPRDKVLAVLSLACEEGFTPDYSLPVESVYIGVTAHIIQNLHYFEVLALAGASRKKFNIPSWVPDWSQHLVQSFPQGLLHSEVDVWPDDVGMDFAMRLIFDGIADSPTEIQVNANTGSLQIRATKLCDISGTVSWVIGRSKLAVVMPFGERGTLVISLLDKSYEVEKDSLFLLDGWDHPVILRSDPSTGAHSLISVCAIYYTPPPRGTWFNPWIGTAIDFPSELKISKFSPGENDLILAFDSRLMELSEAQFSSEREDAGRIRLDAARARILEFGLLSLTPLREIEGSLKSTWKELDQKLGWMCLDQNAVLKLLQDITQGTFEHPTTGHGQAKLNELNETGFKYSRLEFPSEYEWDLERFCWSFIYPSTSTLTVPDSTWTPMYPKLKEQLAEFQKWAEVTEQLLRIFQYSHDTLTKSWNLFPGTNLPEKWLYNWENFRNATATAFDSSKGVSAGKPLDTNCFWDWREFKNSLSLREKIWNERTPPLLDPSTSPNIAAHLGLKSLGLNLYCQTEVTIS